MHLLADDIVRALRERGVRALFGVPGGGGNLDLIAAAGRAGLPFVLTATETAAAIAAMAQAEVTGTIGACLTTLGPGAASAVNGVACAHLDRAPLLLFTDSYSSAMQGVYEHQRLDQRALMASITKLSLALAPDTAVQTLACAIDLATGDRPGPVHLDCPGDVLSSAASVSPRRPPGSGSTSAAVDRQGQSQSAAVAPVTFDELVACSVRPLLLVGLGARDRRSADAIRTLCDRRGIPAMVTYKAKGVVPDDHPWFGGVFTNAVVEKPLVDESDLLIGVGLDPVELLPRPWTARQPVVYAGAWDVDDAHVRFAARWATAIVDAARHLESTLPPSTWNGDRVRELVDAQRQQVRIDSQGLTAHRVVEIAAARLSSAAAHVTVDAGAHMFPATMLWPVRLPNGMLISNGLSTMGFALPAAIGAALLDRQKLVVALTGDGGLLMCIGELLTAARERLPVLVIVFNDASLSLIEIKQRARQLPPSGVALGSVDWQALAVSLGVSASVALDEEQLAASLDTAVANPRPHLIEARIDRSNYGATLRAVRG
jgi:acetolactate synthase-1/2/3 large subunit